MTMVKGVGREQRAGSSAQSHFSCMITFRQLQAAPGCSINLVPCPRGMDLGWPWGYQTKLSARQRSIWQGSLRRRSRPPWRPTVVGPEGFSPQIFACRDRATEVGEIENRSVPAPPGSMMTELEGT